MGVGVLLDTVLLLIFFPVTLINVCIYLFVREKDLYKRYKVWIIGVAVGLILMFLGGSAFAQDGRGEVHNGFHTELKETTKILQTQGVQRYIGILERMPEKIIETPYFTIPGNHLHVIQKVQIETPEYFFTLGALYLADKQVDNAVMAIKAMYNDHVLSKETAKKETALILAKGVRFLLEQKREEQASMAWLSASGHIDNIKLLLNMSDYFEKEGLSDLTERSFDRASLIAEKSGKLLTVVDFLLNKGETEEAKNAFSLIVYNVKLDKRKADERLLSLMDLAVERSLYEAALQAVEKLAIFLGDKANGYELEPPALIDKDDETPDSDKVLLQTIYGALYEKLGSIKEAKEAYKAAVGNRLRQITNTHGYRVPVRINDYYHLRKLLNKTGDTETLALLEPIYQYMKSSLPKKPGEPDKSDYVLPGVSELDRLRDSVERLKQEIGAAEQDIIEKNGLLDSKRKELSQLRVKVVFKFLRLVALTALFLLLFAGAVYKAWQYSKSTVSLKTYGFLAKFLECVGWVKVMTVIGAVTGIVGVFIGQILLLAHRLQQDTELMKHHALDDEDK